MALTQYFCIFLALLATQTVAFTNKELNLNEKFQIVIEQSQLLLTKSTTFVNDIRSKINDIRDRGTTALEPTLDNAKEQLNYYFTVAETISEEAMEYVNEQTFFCIGHIAETALYFYDAAEKVDNELLKELQENISNSTARILKRIKKFEDCKTGKCRKETYLVVIFEFAIDKLQIPKLIDSINGKAETSLENYNLNVDDRVEQCNVYVDDMLEEIEKKLGELSKF